MSFIEQEIQQQPSVIQTLYTEEAANIAAIAAAIREYDPHYIVIVARGTSDNAARYAQYLFGIHANLVVSLATPSVHTLYQSPPLFRDALVIGISQSGASEDVRRVIDDANAQNALTLAITNNPDSPLANTARHHIDMHAGEERSVAATKTYTAELMAVAMLVGALMDDGEYNAVLAHASGYVAQTIETARTQIPKWIERYRYMERYAVISRGYNYATAFEISLKIKELCYIPGEQYSEADFLHGPVALVQAGFPVMLVMPNGAIFKRQSELLQRLRNQDAEVLVISNNDHIQPIATKYMPIPAGIPEWITPLPAVVPGQVFAMHLAAARGLSLDQPRGLNKVTVTE